MAGVARTQTCRREEATRGVIVRCPTSSNLVQSRPISANLGQSRPISANLGQARPISANLGARPISAANLGHPPKISLGGRGGPAGGQPVGRALRLCICICILGGRGGAAGGQPVGRALRRLSIGLSCNYLHGVTPDIRGQGTGDRGQGAPSSLL